MLDNLRVALLNVFLTYYSDSLSYHPWMAVMAAIKTSKVAGEAIKVSRTWW
ncbi:hypothetical protein H6769_04405 [Candidatus Peribacteria bacterium]|nr:hypothetical protein [Candidatus Peribacteria bacterium]